MPCSLLAVYYLGPIVGGTACPARYCTSALSPPGFAPQLYAWTISTTASASLTPSYTPTSLPTPSITPSQSVSASFSNTPVSITSTASPTSSYEGSASDPCFTHATLADPTRAYNFTPLVQSANGQYCGDSAPLFVEGWYRFLDGSGFTYLAWSYSGIINGCGAEYGFHSPGPYPTLVGQVTAAPAQWNGLASGIQIKHCGAFLIYYLTAIGYSCFDARYCTSNVPPPASRLQCIHGHPRTRLRLLQQLAPLRV